MKVDDKQNDEPESPTDVKRQIHHDYDERAISVARGRLGYQPAMKSRYSKSASRRFCHKIEFK
ncbi:hypothetical protein MA78_000423 [Salmonella enterica subsp. enterica]|nr:hypothetical protein [Salmonella enterica subsp. enterica serovar Javiana]EGH2803462.1 hypothetical protein [Salmonella enterica]